MSSFFAAFLTSARLDRADLEAGEVRAGAIAALVAALRLELQPVDLLSLLVAGHDRLDLHPAEVAAVEHGLVAVGEQQRLEVDLVALVRGHAVDEDRIALLDAVLLTADSHDRVAHGSGRV